MKGREIGKIAQRRRGATQQYSREASGTKPRLVIEDLENKLEHAKQAGPLKPEHEGSWQRQLSR
eukprot:3092520-Rhodomonas_salina.1